MGVGAAWGTRAEWKEWLHPRGYHGRFKNKGVLSSLANAIEKLAQQMDKFNPRTFQSQGQANDYLFNLSQKSHGKIDATRFIHEFDHVNDALRAGQMDPSTKKYVDMMDGGSITLPQDTILSKVVGADAFGLDAQHVHDKDSGIQSMVGRLFADKGFTMANIGPEKPNKKPGQITMRVAVPAGTKVNLRPGQRDGGVVLPRDQELRITKVNPDGVGGYYVMAVATEPTPGLNPEPFGGAEKPNITPSAREARLQEIRKTPRPYAPKSEEGAGRTPEEARQAAQQSVLNPPETQTTRHERSARLGTPEPSPTGPTNTGANGPAPRQEPIAHPSIGTAGGGATRQPTAPGAAPEHAPVQPQSLDFRRAARNANLEPPSNGPRRKEWRNAYEGVANGKKNPEDVLRELEKDIDVNEAKLHGMEQRGENIQQADPLLRHDIQRQRDLADLIRREHGFGPRPKQQQEAAPVKKAAKKAAAPKASVTNISEAPSKRAATKAAPSAPEAPAPAKKAAAPRGRMTLTEARRRTAIDAMNQNQIEGDGSKLHGEILRRLEAGDMTPVQARAAAVKAQKAFEDSASGALKNDNQDAADRANGVADKFRNLAEKLHESGSVIHTDKYRNAPQASEPAKAAKAVAKKAMPEVSGPKDLEKNTIAELRKIAEDEGIPLPKRATKAQIIGHIRDNRFNKEHGGTRLIPKEIGKANSFADAGLDKPIPELKKIAADEGVKLHSKMSKADIQQAILDSRDLRGAAAKRAAKAAAPSVGEENIKPIGDEAILAKAEKLRGKENLDPVQKLTVQRADRILAERQKAGVPSAPKKAVEVAPTAVKKAEAAKAAVAGKPDLGALKTELDGETNNVPNLSREQANERLANLSRADLLSLARDYNVPRASTLNKEQLRREIVDTTVGRKLDSIATRGFTGKSPFEPGVTVKGGVPEATPVKKAAKKAAPSFMSQMSTEDRATARKFGLPDNHPLAKLSDDISAADSEDEAMRLMADLKSDDVNQVGRQLGIQFPAKMGPEERKQHIARSLAAHGSGPKANPVKQAAAATPIKAPDRKADFTDDFKKANIQVPDSAAGRSMEEIRDDVAVGHITPNEGIRRLENDIEMNKSDLADLQAEYRRTGNLEDPVRANEQKRLLAEAKRLKEDIAAQEKMATFMHGHFQKAPEVTPDELKMELTPEQMDALDKATPDSLKRAAKIAGLDLGDIKGDTKEEVWQNMVKAMARQELKRRGLPDVPQKLVEPKAPDVPKPDIAESPYKRIDVNALAEGLNIHADDSGVLKDVQDLLDGKSDRLGKNPTPAKIADDIDQFLKGPGSPFMKAIVARELIGEKKPWETERQFEARRKGGLAEAADLSERGAELKRLSARLRQTRRVRKEHAPEVRTQEPKLAAPEKADIAKVAEATGIPAPQLEKKALAKKVAEAPPKASAQQVADTLKTINDPEEARKLLEGRTKADLLEIGKARGRSFPASATKGKIVDGIVGDFQAKANSEALQETVQGIGKPRGFTRTQLEDMNPGDLVPIEEQLGIKRTSMLKSDRIDSIMEAQANLPTPTKRTKVEPTTRSKAVIPEAQTKIATQERKDGIQAVGEDLRKLTGDQASKVALTRTLDNRLKSLEQTMGNKQVREDVQPVLDAVKAGDNERALRLMEDVEAVHDIKKAVPAKAAALAKKATAPRLTPHQQKILDEFHKAPKKDGWVKERDFGAPGTLRNLEAKERLESKTERGPQGGEIRSYRLKEGAAPSAPEAPAPVKKAARAAAPKPTGSVTAGRIKEGDTVSLKAPYKYWRDPQKVTKVERVTIPRQGGKSSQSGIRITRADGSTKEFTSHHAFHQYGGEVPEVPAPVKAATPVKKATGAVPVKAAPQAKFSDKPLESNAYGSGGGRVNFHPDGHVGMAIKGLTEDQKRLNIDGEPLANVMGELVTKARNGDITTEQMLNGLKDLRARVGDPGAKAKIARAIEEIDSAKRHVDIPSDAPEALKELIRSFEANPLTRGMGRGGNDSELQKAEKLALDIARNDGKFSKARLTMEIRNLLGGRHESEEGYYELLRAVQKALKDLGGR